MKTLFDAEGDLGQFIISELGKRDVLIHQKGELGHLPATWRTFTLELGGAREGLAAAAKGCSLDSVSSFLFSLLSPSRLNRPFAKDDDKSFWFSIDEKQGSFERTDKRLVVAFIACGVALTIVENNQELNIGISKHPKEGAQ